MGLCIGTTNVSHPAQLPIQNIWNVQLYKIQHLFKWTEASMKKSYHHYPCCAPWKPDISCCVIGLSQMLMSRAVTELLLKKKKKNAAIGFQESDSLLSTNCEVQRRTIWYSQLTPEQSVGRFGRENNLMAQRTLTCTLKSRHVLPCYYNQPNCHSKSESRSLATIDDRLRLHTTIKSTVSYSETLCAWITEGVDCVV